jgi:RNA polymerase sigma factor (sigma-70 family)
MEDLMDDIQLSGLILRTAYGDVGALEQIFIEMKDGIFSLALMHMNSRQLAEDVVQETILQVYNSSKNFRNTSNPKAWILTIARNIAVSAFRKTRHETELDENILDIADDQSFENAVCGYSDMMALVSSLSKVESEIVILHAVSDLSHKEIAKLLHIPLGTVCRKYSVGIKKLKSTYIEKGAV